MPTSIACFLVLKEALNPKPVTVLEELDDAGFGCLLPQALWRLAEHWRVESLPYLSVSFFFESRGLQRLAFRCLGLGVQDLGFFLA